EGESCHELPAAAGPRQRHRRLFLRPLQHARAGQGQFLPPPDRASRGVLPAARLDAGRYPQGRLRCERLPRQERPGGQPPGLPGRGGSRHGQEGSALIVESVDRISRQGIDEGYDLCKRILKAGIRLVTLTPEREYGAEAVKKLTAGALELQLILEQAAEES